MKVFRRIQKRLRKQPDTVSRRRFQEPSDTEFDVSRRYLRNRTLSQTAPQEVSPSERERVHSMTMRRNRILLVFMVILGISIFLIALLSQLSGQVTVGISSATTSKVDATGYQRAINDYLGQHPVERFRFALNKAGLTTYVTSVNPEVASVTQAADFGLGETHFSVALREPLAGWRIQGKQYYVDEQGVAFEHNYFAEPGVQIVDEAGVSFQEGTTVTSTRFLSFIGKIVAQAKGKGMEVIEARLPLGTTRQVVIKVSGKDYEFRLSIDRGAGEQVEDISRVEKYLSDRGINPRYVDVRVEGRAFYQ